MSKFDSIPGLSLADMRSLFRQARTQRDRLALGDAIAHFGLPAPQADAALHRLARAGYLTAPPWTLTALAIQLAMDRALPRIDRGAVDRILATVLDRVRALNADPDRLHRVTRLWLFGSALDQDRADYGDVDIEVKIAPRPLAPDPAARVSDRVRHEHRYSPDPVADHAAAAMLRDLGEGLRHLSLFRDELRHLHCPYRLIYAFEAGAGRELPPDAVPDTLAMVERPPAPPADLPPQTAIAPVGLPPNAAVLQFADGDVRLEELPDLEGTAWSGIRSAGGILHPRDVTGHPRLQLAGVQHLCPVPSDDAPGMAVLLQALDWAAAVQAEIAARPRSLRLVSSHGRRTASYADDLVVRRTKTRIRAGLLPRGEDRASRNDIAARHAVALALGRLLDEVAMPPGVNLQMQFDLGSGAAQMPDLRSVARALKAGGEGKVCWNRRARRERGDLPERLAAVAGLMTVRMTRVVRPD